MPFLGDNERPVRMPRSAMEITSDLKRASEQLYNCSRERFSVHRVGDFIVKGVNEMHSMYALPDADEVAKVAEQLEAVVRPLRERRTVELVASIRSLLEELEASEI